MFWHFLHVRGSFSFFLSVFLSWWHPNGLKSAVIKYSFSPNSQIIPKKTIMKDAEASSDRFSNSQLPLTWRKINGKTRGASSQWPESSNIRRWMCVSYVCVCLQPLCRASPHVRVQGHVGLVLSMHLTFLTDGGSCSTQMGVRTSHICKAGEHGVKEVTARQMS